MPLNCTLMIVKRYILCRTHVATIGRKDCKLSFTLSALKKSRSSDGLTEYGRDRQRKGKGGGKEEGTMCFLLGLSHKYLNSYYEPITVVTTEFWDSAGLRALSWVSLIIKAGESKGHFYPLPRVHYTWLAHWVLSQQTWDKSCYSLSILSDDWRRHKEIKELEHSGADYKYPLQDRVDTPSRRLSSVLSASQTREPTDLPWASLCSQRFGLAFMPVILPSCELSPPRPASHCMRCFFGLPSVSPWAAR